MRPTAEVWCWASHGASGKPHAYRLARIYWRSGQLDAELTDGVEWSASESTGGAVVEFACPTHGALRPVDAGEMSPQGPGVRRKPRQVRVTP